MDSEGQMRIWGIGDGQDGHDAIEHIAALPWCTGKVAMLGNSWLAISQWFIAAERPKHLACIAPLEGVSDPLREQLRRGGIPERQFWRELGGMLCGLSPFLLFSNRFGLLILIFVVWTGRNGMEDMVGMAQETELTSDYWEDKRARIDRIEVPAYILASYSTMLHTVGSFRGYEDIPHGAKW